MSNKPKEDVDPQAALIATLPPDQSSEYQDGLPESFRNIAHELRTPIGAIIAFAEMIEREQFGPVGDERYRSYARDIQEAARLSLGIVATGLDQYADPKDLLAGPISEVDFDNLSRSILRIFEGAAREANVSLKFDAPQSPLRILTDEASLKQILLNLIGNAIKFTPPGGSVTLKAALNDALEITVSDTGLGMTQADVDILLGSDNRDGGSNSGGIGFSLVRRLCADIGAQLQVSSTRGAGTSVSLRFDHTHLPK